MNNQKSKLLTYIPFIDAIGIYIFLFIVFILIALSNSGCTAITNPVQGNIESEYISYDEGEQNSGIYAISNDNKGFYVTRHFIDRYQAMLKEYGYKLNIEKMDKNEGIVKINDTTYFIDNQRMQYFLAMNNYRKQNFKLKKN